MKRSFLSGILVIVVLVIALSGCSGSTKASDKAISIGKQAVSVVDDYLDGKLTYDEADEKLDGLKSDMQYVDDLPQDDEHKAADFGISTDITLISHDLLIDNVDNTSESYDELVDRRNALAEEVGEKKR